MPVERKPLFRAEDPLPAACGPVLGFEAEPAREILRQWARLLTVVPGRRLNENELLARLPDRRVLRVLGYPRPSPPASATPSRARSTSRWTASSPTPCSASSRRRPRRRRRRWRARGRKTRSTGPSPGRKMSAVDQAYRYAINLPCDWIIVTICARPGSTTRDHDQYTYERFDTEALAGTEAAFRRFVFLLGAERVVPAAGPCHLDELLPGLGEGRPRADRSFYADTPTCAGTSFASSARPTRPCPEILLLGTQKLLDRILFIAFCEDRGLLPAETMRRAYEHRDPYNPRRSGRTSGACSGPINRRQRRLNIPAYNGGLFADDPASTGSPSPTRSAAISPTSPTTTTGRRPRSTATPPAPGWSTWRSSATSSSSRSPTWSA